MIEVHGIGAQGAVRRVDDGFGRATLQVEPGSGPAARQKQRSRGQYRPARQHHIAELEADWALPRRDFGRFRMQITGRAIDPEVVGEKGGEICHHVGISVPGEASGDLLERDDIGALKALGDSFEIVEPVETEAVLYVIARKPNDNL
jgi:hypothetical protein